MAVLENTRYERFAQAIVAGKSGRVAYRAAGYQATAAAADVAASRLLKHAKVAARIAELKAAAAEKTAVTVARVIEELAKIAFANMADYMAQGADGDPYLDFSALTRDQAAALSEVTVEDFKDGRGEDARDVRRVKFKMCDKRAALVDLGKHLGMFNQVQRHEVTGADGGPIETKSTSDLSDIDVARRVAFLLSKATKAPAPTSPDPGSPEQASAPARSPAKPKQRVKRRSPAPRRASTRKG